MSAPGVQCRRICWRRSTDQKAEQANASKADIQRYQAARKAADSSFNADRDRLKVLLGRH